jgi:crossover junction endodeoxyribonuclease RusA
MICVLLPYPPSANRLWRNVPGKGTLKSGHYRLWLAEALASLRAQRAPTLKGSYQLTISATPPDRRKRDLDNIAKPISDALKDAGVIEGDHLARRIVLEWSNAEPAKPGAVTVYLEAA